jgi:hypothetical protein
LAFYRCIGFLIVERWHPNVRSDLHDLVQKRPLHLFNAHPLHFVDDLHAAILRNGRSGWSVDGNDNGASKFSNRLVAFDNLYAGPMGLRASFAVLLKVLLRTLTFAHTAKNGAFSTRIAGASYSKRAEKFMVLRALNQAFDDVARTQADSKSRTFWSAKT